MSDAGSPLDTAQVLVVGSTNWSEPFSAALSASTEATIHTATTTADALDTVRQQSVDCLVTGETLDDESGIELVRQLRDVASDLPVVLGTTDGSEALASEAIQAGVSDYVPLSGTDGLRIDDLIERTEKTLQSAQRAITQRERARQFDAVFQDTQTATWVLDPGGSLARVNQTGQAMIAEAVDAVIGDLFWTLPCWSQSEATERDIRKLVEAARDGQFGNAVVHRPTTATDRVIELSVRPVRNDFGDVTSIVIEGIDITDQVTLDRDLRQSEELHRVTLSNMTDTVLMTNEDGEFTYVCPNVHFIFGYTDDEIRGQETIDTLLGEDLFDRAELAEKGVLKNIECTVTDKAGHEHTLLVNVREVAIQGGTLLYSCRDITKRKQREEALATLQETARKFLYTETNQEIAQHIVDDVLSVFDVSANAIYLHDAETNELQPVAQSQAMTEHHGPLPAVRTNDDTLPSHSFVNDETLVFDDVHTSDRLENRATDLRSVMFIPLGNHGVFVSGSTAVGVFDDVTQELTDLLAATAEAALDRVVRESQLREQDRELQRQNEQLTALNHINNTIREIDQTIVSAETQEEINHTVCERLTDTDRFKFAWIGSVDPGGTTVEPRAWAGNEQGYLDSQSIAVADSETEPAGQTAATGDVTMIPNVAADLRNAPWRSDALTRDLLSVLSIPLVYNDLRHGVLTIYADTKDAFDETTRTVLRELGETIASALSAIERKHALLTTSVTRVEFDIDDERFLLSRLARSAGCSLSYEGGIQHAPAGNSVFVTVEDADVQTVAAAAADMTSIDDVTQISDDDAGSGVLRLELSQPFLALELADHGAIFRAATADPDGTTLVVDVPQSVDVRNIAQLVDSTFSGVELKRKETLERGIEQDRSSEFLTDLTERQLEVIQTAYYSGYFESPRTRSGEDIAAMLEISPPAFYQHVRTVQRKLFTTLFEDRSVSGLES
ncbi:bacterio-opsin activator domain-containing protein [Haloarcula argentinensis]|uniref:GAF domain-containing protein n=1 Tax=Haloarcula argentinensis TaxID=43776 RepID=A0ABU2F5E7_HALAR|nr:bacterio-opsin activator domain-containing protein [Haloarcula argentinensis]EMA26495.1 bacterio-opsin activator-like protein [Haloarcula argentinensis DSM 12282]MDS0255336.1 GAF domain-containing protein [Haloarcula argentinensis]